MKIVIAPDSFKGSLTSKEAGEAIKEGVLKVYPQAQCHNVLIADGGEGTVDAIVHMTHGEIMHATVHGPLDENVDAIWGLCETAQGKTAVIEMAQASGILIGDKHNRDVKRASTYGTGELLKAALDANVKNIIIGIGGSATNDGGCGMAEALGARFLDEKHNPLPHGGAALSRLHDIDISNLDKRLKDVTISIASDVKNPLCGNNGASAVYGPQKGATPEDVLLLDEALRHYADVAYAKFNLDIKDLPGAGAAGGLGAGLMLFLNGQMKNGINLILSLIDFESIVKDATLVITGEGYTDFQTKNGKAPVGVATIAKKYGIPVILISGGVSEDANVLYKAGIDALIGTPCAPISLDECIHDAKKLLTQQAERVLRFIKVGSLLKD